MVSVLTVYGVFNTVTELDVVGIFSGTHLEGVHVFVLPTTSTLLSLLFLV